jgi:hypothetical protein
MFHAIAPSEGNSTKRTDRMHSAELVRRYARLRALHLAILDVLDKAQVAFAVGAMSAGESGLPVTREELLARQIDCARGELPRLAELVGQLDGFNDGTGPWAEVPPDPFSYYPPSADVQASTLGRLARTRQPQKPAAVEG